MVDASRRGFFRGRPKALPAQRPPWARPEAEFIVLCTRCNECIAACPTGIVMAGDGGFPTIDFKCGECTFCRRCVDACAPQALTRPSEDTPPWALVAQLGDACLPRHGVECRICGEHCDARAIRFQPRLGGSPEPQIDSERCAGCGACVAPCPVNALSVS